MAKPEDAPIGTGMANEAKEDIKERKKQMKPAECYLLGKEYDRKTRQCVG